MLTEKDKDKIINHLYGEKRITLKQFWILEKKIDKQEDRDRLAEMLFTLPKPTMQQTNEFLKRNTQ